MDHFQQTQRRLFSNSVVDDLNFAQLPVGDSTISTPGKPHQAMDRKQYSQLAAGLGSHRRVKICGKSTLCFCILHLFPVNKVDLDSQNSLILRTSPLKQPSGPVPKLPNASPPPGTGFLDLFL
jgi:hypothetical protein